MNTTINVPVVHILTLETKQAWINSCPRKLPKKRPGESFLFLDKNGNSVERGSDFSKAEELGTYPIKVYRTVNICAAALPEPL